MPSSNDAPQILGLDADEAFVEYHALCLAFEQVASTRENAASLFRWKELADESIQEHLAELLRRHDVDPNAPFDSFQFTHPLV